MKITGKSKTAIKALIVLGLNENRLSVREIAEKEDLPVRYLEQLISSLKKAKLVTSVKGPSGGYSLSKTPDQITLLDIVSAVDGMNLFSDNEKGLLSEIINDKVLKPLDESVYNKLRSLSLQELIDLYKEKSNQEYMYYI